ncbi:MAG TPA: protein-glutamate O-methyltransferase CheR [Steroidobacteraceae bacterium]|nr:protein-glutamate O-methyltransferase CheR [Steroidobacteraceae bacterium]
MATPDTCLTDAGPDRSPGSSGRLREFAYETEDFEAISTLVKALTGIHLTPQKRELVYGRLAVRLRALGIRTFRDYRRIIAANPQEQIRMCNAITTNLTSFFREAHHFEHLRDQVLPAYRERGGQRRLRIWSAGCASGEEPYSIAMVVLEALPEDQDWNVRILATDLDSDVLAIAARGQYADDRIRGLSEGRLRRFFTEHRDRGGSSFIVRPEVRRLVTFKQLNLMQPLPMPGPLDVVFCRNTVIYFDKDTQRNLFARIAPLQRPGDLLYLGHSESLLSVSVDYESIGRTTYLRR